MRREEEVAAVAPIREAVLGAARTGVDPRIVITVLLKQASEIGVTTYCTTREEFLAVAGTLWDQSNLEHLERVGKTSEVGDA